MTTNAQVAQRIGVRAGSSMLLTPLEGRARAAILRGRKFYILAGSARVPARRGFIQGTSIAGLVAGFGIDLLAEVDDEKTAIIIPTAGATIGLLVAGYSFRAPGTVEQNRRGLPGGALLQLGAAPGFDIPLPIPSSVLGRGRDGALVRKPAIRFDLLRVSF